jgi:hypothetical protein
MTLAVPVGISVANAFANNEVVFLAWRQPRRVNGLLGFEVTRIYVSDGGPDAPAGHEMVLPAWVPFKGQRNSEWAPQTTTIWPVQKFSWRDLTVRQHHEGISLRPSNVVLKYRIRAVVPAGMGMSPVPQPQHRTFDGPDVPLDYLDDGIETNQVHVTHQFGNIWAAFNNGILATQWLTHAFKETGLILSASNLKVKLKENTSPFRTYMSGDILPMLRKLFDIASNNSGWSLYMALYELEDPELIGMIKDHGRQVHLILSNTSKNKEGEWDLENAPARDLLRGEVAELHDRMFNNQHIGHNKFVVLADEHDNPRAVLTGSTNWTTTGLCTQSNNAVLIDDRGVAAQYKDYWEALRADTQGFDQPVPLSAGTKNHQSHELRKANRQDPESVDVEGTEITLWRSPNDPGRTTTGKDVPPDLGNLFSIMRKAKKAIFFAVFLPSVEGAHSIVEEAINLGLKDPDLLVYGVVSDPKAMPNYAPKKETGEEPPATFDNGNVHLVRASAIRESQQIGDFESELLNAGFAIIHDKIVVVDPKDGGTVATGSHNLGFKASYENDDNLLVMRSNNLLAQSFAVHIADLFDHYRFRAIQAERQKQGKPLFEGFLSTDDRWQDKYFEEDRIDISDYFAG